LEAFVLKERLEITWCQFLRTKTGFGSLLTQCSRSDWRSPGATF
jgi:hypothetical protein